MRTNSKTLLIAAVLAAAALPALASTAHNVPWYLANAGARSTELATCQADPADLAATPDCENAQAAAYAAALAAL